MENLAAVPPATPRGQLGEHLPSPLLLLEPALPGAVPPSRGGSSSTQGHWLFPSPPPPPPPRSRGVTCCPRPQSAGLRAELWVQGQWTPCPTEQGSHGPNSGHSEADARPGSGPAAPGLCHLHPSPRGRVELPLSGRLHLPRLPLSSGLAPRVIWAWGVAGVTVMVANRPQRQR